MKKLQSFASTLLISILVMGVFVFSTSANSVSTYKIDGYIKDAQGVAVAGACLIFNNATVPSVQTNSQGYYSVNAPAGTYHISVWPPFDSSYINYDEASYTVSGDAVKNVTLLTGFKVSGYIKDTQGAPVVGAVVQLGNYLSGWFSNSNGYYFLAVPAGSYTINAHPRIGTYQTPTTSFQTYTESGFAVYADIPKNLTVTIASSPTPTPVPTSAPTTTPTANPTSTPSPTPPLPLSNLTLTTEASSYQVGSTLTIKGALTDENSNPLPDKTITISYASGTETWTNIGSAQTDTSGNYNLQWLIPASGTFTLKVEWQGDQTAQTATNSTTVSFVPVQGQKMFFVQSNSTITNLGFNSTSLELSFTASGTSGSSGYTEVTIAKTLVADASTFAVHLDGNQLQFTLEDHEDSWILIFLYLHSTHHITVDLASQATTPPAVDSPVLIAVVVTVAIIAILAGLVVYRKTHKP